MKKLFGRRSPVDEAGSGRSTAAPAKIEPQMEHPEVVHADPEQMDTETRAMYRDARDAAADAAEERARIRPREYVIKSPFQVGFTVTLGVLVALLFGGMIGQLSTILMYVAAALFVALGLEPVVRALERRSIKRPAGIAIVFGGFVVVIGLLLAKLIPMIAQQITQLIRDAPGMYQDIIRQDWFRDLNSTLTDMNFPLSRLLDMGSGFISKPENWASVAGGVWQAGLGIANGMTASVIILILALYFLASMRTMKRAFYSVVPRSGRAKVMDITEQVTKSVGGYVNGMVILAFLNAGLGFIMMTVIGVPFAGLVAVGVFLLALIPLIGSVVATVLVTVVALFAEPSSSLLGTPGTAIAAAVYYVIYMQLEAYLLTPRIMNRVVSVPGSLVVIGALAGGTLLGLLGALIAIPVTAMVLMIIKQVWIPRQESR